MQTCKISWFSNVLPYLFLIRFFDFLLNFVILLLSVLQLDESYNACIFVSQNRWSRVFSQVTSVKFCTHLPFGLQNSTSHLSRIQKISTFALHPDSKILFPFGHSKNLVYIVLGFKNQEKNLYYNITV